MQRVAIASAIAEDNDIILLDEPTSGLDYKHMMDISEILKELQSMGKNDYCGNSRWRVYRKLLTSRKLIEFE